MPKKQKHTEESPEILASQVAHLLSIIRVLQKDLDDLFVEERDGRVESAEGGSTPVQGNELNETAQQLEMNGNTPHREHYTISSTHIAPSSPRNLDRLKNLFQLEDQMLASLIETPHRIKRQHVKSTNVYVYHGMVEIMKEEVARFGKESVVAVLETAKWVEDASKGSTQKNYHSKQHKSQSQSLTVDLVLRFGAVWLKVKARNQRAVQENFLGMTDGSEKCITQVAEEMRDAASLWPVNYEPRQCVIYFTKGVTLDVAEALKEMGVVVLVKRPEVRDLESMQLFTDGPQLMQAPHEPETVNLDITTLIVLVAQAARNTEDYRQLLEYIRGKKRVVVTHSALKHFSSLVELGADELEKQRAADMILDVFQGTATTQKDSTIPMEIIPDDPDEVVSKSLKGAKIKPYHKLVFGTAHKHQYLTSTSNAWLVSCAESRNIHLSVRLHRSYTLALFDRNDMRKQRERRNGNQQSAE